MLRNFRVPREQSAKTDEKQIWNKVGVREENIKIKLNK